MNRMGAKMMMKLPILVYTEKLETSLVYHTKTIKWNGKICGIHTCVNKLLLKSIWMRKLHITNVQFCLAKCDHVGVFWDYMWKSHPISLSSPQNFHSIPTRPRKNFVSIPIPSPLLQRLTEYGFHCNEQYH